MTLTRGLIFQGGGGEFGRSLSRPSGALIPAVRPLLAEACCSGLLCRGVSLQSPMFRDFMPTSPALPVREDRWYISAGVGSAILPVDRVTPLRTSCRGIVLWESRMLLGLLPWTVVVCSRTFCALCWLCIMPSGMGLPDTERAGVTL